MKTFSVCEWLNGPGANLDDDEEEDDNVALLLVNAFFPSRRPEKKDAMSTCRGAAAAVVYLNGVNESILMPTINCGKSCGQDMR